MPDRRSNIEVLIPTYNEELNLPHCLESVCGWADAVRVIDSESSDRTRAIAESFGALVTSQPWLGYARQKNFGLDNLGFEAEWILILDADELVLPELRDELLALASGAMGRGQHDGYYINRYLIFLGKRIRHCGYYPSWNLRFFRRGKARYEEREVHEHMLVDGTTGYLRGHLEHQDRRGLEEYFAKHNRYSTLEARETVRLAGKPAEQLLDAKLFGNGLQRRRWIKQHVYPRLPAKWLFRFLFMYVLRLGFLDGLTGLRFCMFLSMYEHLIQLKIVELEKGLAPAADSTGDRLGL